MRRGESRYSAIAGCAAKDVTKLLSRGYVSNECGATCVKKYSAARGRCSEELHMVSGRWIMGNSATRRCA